MKKTLFVALSCLALSASLAMAQGANYGGQAYLSWSRDATVRDIPQACGDQLLFVKLSNIAEIKGCEFGIAWSPDEATNGSVIGGVNFPTSSGTVCTYLMRGAVVTVEVTPDNGSYYAIAGAGSGLPTTACSFGNVANIDWDFSGSMTGCNLTPVAYGLSYCKVTDHLGVVNNMTIIGAATIGGATAAQPTTWGAIKSTFKN